VPGQKISRKVENKRIKPNLPLYVNNLVKTPYNKTSASIE